MEENQGKNVNQTEEKDGQETEQRKHRKIEEILKIRLRELRNQKGWSMQQIADRCHMAKSTYAGYERGTRFPSIDNLDIVADILDTSPDYLLGTTDNPSPTNLKGFLEHTTRGPLHWNGEELTPDQLEAILNLLERFIPQKQSDAK